MFMEFLAPLSPSPKVMNDLIPCCRRKKIPTFLLSLSLTVLRHRLHHHLQQRPWHSVMRSVTSVRFNRAAPTLSATIARWSSSLPKGVPDHRKLSRMIFSCLLLHTPPIIRFLSSLLYPHNLRESPGLAMIFLNYFCVRIRSLPEFVGDKGARGDSHAMAHKQIYLLDQWHRGT